MIKKFKIKRPYNEYRIVQKEHEGEFLYSTYSTYFDENGKPLLVSSTPIGCYFESKEDLKIMMYHLKKALKKNYLIITKDNDIIDSGKKVPKWLM